LLLFDRTIATVRRRLDLLRTQVERQAAASAGLRERTTKRLHEAQKSHFSHSLEMLDEGIDDAITKVAANATVLEKIPTGLWNQEREGVIPLTTVAAEAPRLGASLKQATSELAALAKEYEKEESRAPRVLNANFAEPDGMIL